MERGTVGTKIHVMVLYMLYTKKRLHRSNGLGMVNTIIEGI